MISKMLEAYVKKGKYLAQMEKKPAYGVMPGDTAPEIALPNPYGDTLKLSSLKGNMYLSTSGVAGANNAATCTPKSGNIT
jgi:hypothetical protein